MTTTKPQPANSTSMAYSPANPERSEGGLITHKYRGSQSLSRIEYSTQIYIFDTRGPKNI